MTNWEECPYPLFLTLCSSFGTFCVNAKIGRVISNSFANLEFWRRIDWIEGVAFGYSDRWYNWAEVVANPAQAVGGKEFAQVGENCSNARKLRTFSEEATGWPKYLSLTIK